MNDHGGHDGRMIAEELMEAGTGRPGLDRRQLLGGLVAGAAGLLLPGQEASARLRDIQLDINNRAWPTVSLSFWQLVGPGKKYGKLSNVDLTGPQRYTFQSPRPKQSQLNTNALLQIDGFYNIDFTNPAVGDPRVTWTQGSNPDTAADWGGSYPLEVNHGTQMQIASNKWVLVMRRADSDNYKKFDVEFRDKPWPQSKLDEQDEQDNKGNNGNNGNNNGNNGNNKRRRKRRGGGLSNTDRRKRPVDRLLD